MAPQAFLSTLDGFILLAVPLFLLMSNVLLYGGCGRDLYSAVQAWVGHWPGGLAIATIVSCGIFAAISGVSVATAAAIGVVAIPEMIERGYNELHLRVARRWWHAWHPDPAKPADDRLWFHHRGKRHFSVPRRDRPGLFLIGLFIVYAIVYAHFFGGYTPTKKASWDVRRKSAIKVAPTIGLAA